VNRLLRRSIAAMAFGAGACASTMVAEPSGLLITEVAAAGEPEDWVEVMNTSEAPVDLDDFVIVDKRDAIDRARPVGAVTLGPGERYVRVISDATVGFRLAGDEEVWIYRAGDGALVDGVDWNQGASTPGGSLARQDDVGAFRTVAKDTRGQTNRVGGP
jgi:hypothetical protein